MSWVRLHDEYETRPADKRRLLPLNAGRSFIQASTKGKP